MLLGYLAAVTTGSEKGILFGVKVRPFLSPRRTDMIRKIVVKNFKMFGEQEFTLPNRLVIVGPNNTGKTTLLQAIATWSEIAFQWLEKNRDLAREEDENYPGINIISELFYSIPIADFEHLWKDRNVLYPASVWLHTDNWKIGFDIEFKERELAVVRPSKNVIETDLEKYIADPLIPVYVPPLSGVDPKEPPFDPIVLPARLAQAQAGSILRNLLLVVSRDDDKWNKLKDVIRSYFGYELDHPSGAPEIYARYRHSPDGPSYDISSAASGFLQVLMVYAALFATDASVLLIDEPDAHLHILLQDRLYRDLRNYTQENGTQLIIATHSVRLIDSVADSDLGALRILSGNLREVPNKKNLTDTMLLEHVDIYLAQTEPRILYVEGFSDIDHLREWALVLDHPLLSFLQKPFWRDTTQQSLHKVSHFKALKLMVPSLKAFELCDGDKLDSNTNQSTPDGMKRLYWNFCEIESYLLHPNSILRFVSMKGGPEAEQKAEKYMRDQMPPVLLNNPFEATGFLKEHKAKNGLSNLFNASGVRIRETEFSQIASHMTVDEVFPEVKEKLDTIFDHYRR